MGARGAKLSPAAKNAAKRKLAPYYKAFGKKPPWAKKDSGVNIHKKGINKPFHNFDTNKLDVIIRGVTMKETEEEIQEEPDAEVEETGDDIEEQETDNTQEESAEEQEQEQEEEQPEEKILSAIETLAGEVKTLRTDLDKMKMSEEERAEAEKIEAKVAEQLKEKNEELDALKAQS